MRKLTPKQRLRVYKEALEILSKRHGMIEGTYSVCASIAEATEKLYPKIYESYDRKSDLYPVDIFPEQFPEFEAERIDRDKIYEIYWWGNTNLKVRQKFIQECLINKVK